MGEDIVKDVLADAIKVVIEQENEIKLLKRVIALLVIGLIGLIGFIWI